MTARRAAVLVFVIAAIVHAPSIRNGFAYDDVAVIQLDERVHRLAGIPALLTGPWWLDPELGLYRPLVSAGFAVDWAVSGGRPAWFHIVNVAWNAAACTLLFLLLAALAPVPAAMAGALIFAVHPVHVEAVANVVGRAELMAAAFGFAALWLHVRHADTRRAAVATPLLFALALLSKESAIMLPALIALVDAARGDLRPGAVRDWLHRRRALLGTLVLVAAAFVLIRTGVLGGIAPGRVDPALEIGGAVTRRLTALQAWPLVLGLLLTPVTLLADYGPRILMPADGLNLLNVTGAVIVVALVAGGAAAWRAGRGILAMVLLWLPVAMLPVSNLLVAIGVILAERALYLPSAVLAFAVCFGLAALRRHRRAAAAAVALAGVLFTARSLARIPDWQSTETIFAALERDRPESFRAQWHAARLAAVRGDTATAMDRYERAVTLWPHRRGLVLEATSFAISGRDIARAHGLADYMSRRWPGDVDAARLLAGTALDMADSAAAARAIDDGLRAHPDDALLLRMRAALDRDTTP